MNSAQFNFGINNSRDVTTDGKFRSGPGRKSVARLKFLFGQLWQSKKGIVYLKRKEKRMYQNYHIAVLKLKCKIF